MFTSEASISDGKNDSNARTGISKEPKCKYKEEKAVNVTANCVFFCVNSINNLFVNIYIKKSESDGYPYSAYLNN